MATTSRGNPILMTYLSLVIYSSIWILIGDAAVTKGIISSNMALMVDDGIEDTNYEFTYVVEQEPLKSNLSIIVSTVFETDQEDFYSVLEYPEQSSYIVLEYPAGCPEYWYPCYCEKPDLWGPALDTDCGNVEGEEQLSFIFRNATYHDTHLRSFKLTGNPNIRVLHPGVFQHIIFDEIHIGYNNFERVERGALDLMKSKLKCIDFFRANFHDLDDFPFDEIVTYQKLEKIDFGMNRFPRFPEIASESLIWINFGLNPINSIEQDAFRRLPKLEFINLSGTNLAQIYPGTFKGLPYLTDLYLAGNFFVELLAGSITTDSVQFSMLSLENNLISNVEPNSITFDSNMIVDLGQNPIHNLPENIWRPLFEKGGTIWGGYLYLECDCAVAYIVLHPLWNVTTAYCTDGSSFEYLDPSLFEEC